MALPAFTRHTLLLLLSAGRAAIDQYILPAGSTAANLQTGGQVPYRFHTPCSAHHALPTLHTVWYECSRCVQ